MIIVLEFSKKTLFTISCNNSNINLYPHTIRWNIFFYNGKHVKKQENPTVLNISDVVVFAKILDNVSKYPFTRDILIFNIKGVIIRKATINC